MTISTSGEFSAAEAVGLFAAASTEPPPVGLRDRLTRSAAATRHVVDRSMSPIEAVARTIDDLGELLESLEPDDWKHLALDVLTVQQLVGHIIGSDTYLGAAIGAWEGHYPDVLQNDHRATTAPSIEAVGEETPGETLVRWRARAAELVTALRNLDSDALSRPARYNVINGDLRTVLITRTFELWTHTEDICRATGRSLMPPDADRLAVMTDLAASLLPVGHHIAGRAPRSARLRFVLTGPGGGTWIVHFGPDEPQPGEHAMIAADGVEFCRMVARRIDPADLDCDIEGDEEFARDVLVGATQFAMD